MRETLIHSRGFVKNRSSHVSFVTMNYASSPVTGLCLLLPDFSSNHRIFDPVAYSAIYLARKLNGNWVDSFGYKSLVVGCFVDELHRFMTYLKPVVRLYDASCGGKRDAG